MSGFGTPAVAHPHYCDRCLEPVRGTRFHCLVCPDCDFCSSCIAKHLADTAPAVHPHVEFSAAVDPAWTTPLPSCPLTMQSLLEPLSLLSSLMPGVSLAAAPSNEQGARLVTAAKGTYCPAHPRSLVRPLTPNLSPVSPARGSFGAPRLARVRAPERSSCLWK